MSTISDDLAQRTIAGVQRFTEQADVTTDLLSGLAVRIKPVIGWDTGVWFTTDPATTLFTQAYVDGFDSALYEPWFHHELNVADVNLFRDLAGTGSVAVLARSCEDPIAESARHRELMRPVGLEHEVRLTADDRCGTWGAIELHRERGSRPFGEDETQLLSVLAPIIASGIRRQAVTRAALEGAGVRDPGLIYVSREGGARPGTEAGAAWLSLLTPRDEQNIHSALLTLAAVAERPGRTARLRTRTADGQRVTLHVAPAYGDSRESIVIVEPTSPAEVAELLTRAHGLSPRERDVALGLTRGETTEVLAERLGVSPHTLRDHLKAAFRKTGTSSRTELVAHLFASWYAEQLFDVDPHRGD